MPSGPAVAPSAFWEPCAPSRPAVIPHRFAEPRRIPNLTPGRPAGRYIGPIYISDIPSTCRASVAGRRGSGNIMLELAILGLLKERPMHGYQLSRELGESLGGFWRVSYGSLYPTLRRLEREGAVEALPADTAPTPRRKNVYRITEKGEKLFFELLEEAPNDSSTEDTRFRVRLAFFRYLPPETRIRLLERRRVHLEDRLGTIQDSLR